MRPSTRELRRWQAVATAVVSAVIALIWILVWPHLDRSTPEPPEVARQATVKLGGDEAQLFGRVLDTTTREGLSDAVVFIEHAGGRASADADDDGRFSAVIDASPVALIIDAPEHLGAVVFGKLCPGERRRLSVSLAKRSVTATPPAPIVLEEKRCR